eukprot:6194932-Pleurochrysis_carterae.AAC.4
MHVLASRKADGAPAHAVANVYHLASGVVVTQLMSTNSRSTCAVTTPNRVPALMVMCPGSRSRAAEETRVRITVYAYCGGCVMRWYHRDVFHCMMSVKGDIINPLYLPSACSGKVHVVQFAAARYASCGHKDIVCRIKAPYLTAPSGAPSIAVRCCSDNCLRQAREPANALQSGVLIDAVAPIQPAASCKLGKPSTAEREQSAAAAPADIAAAPRCGTGVLAFVSWPPSHQALSVHL